MPNHRISKDKRALVLSALCEGTPINAVCRMMDVAKETVLRVIAETGEAVADYMDKNFRDLPCSRIEMDEQWQYVFKHGQRMEKKVEGQGDYWLWACIDADTKLVLSHRVARRKWFEGECFVEDVAARVRRPVQIATDNHRSYERAIRCYFGYEGVNYGTETKIFGEPASLTEWQSRRKQGVPRIASATREAKMGSPDLGTITTAHVERVFLSVRQQMTRFTRMTLGYSKDLRMHRLSVALYFGVYNLVRKHTSLDGQTPAQAAGVEAKRWTLVDVVDMTERYWQPKREAQKQAKALSKRKAEDAVFFAALNSIQ